MPENQSPKFKNTKNSLIIALGFVKVILSKLLHGGVKRGVKGERTPEDGVFHKVASTLNTG